MSCFPWPSFDPRLTWDGLLTFFGGVLAFFAILFQVRHADTGLQRQLDAEKQARDDQASEQDRAAARALLFELDNFYRGYVQSLTADAALNDALPGLKTLPSAPFAIYRGNAAFVGHLGAGLAAAVVGAHGTADWLLNRMSAYKIARESISQLQRLNAWDEVRKTATNVEVLLHEVSRLLCEFSGVPFEADKIAVAGWMPKSAKVEGAR